MTQALNYTVKALEAFASYSDTALPGCQAGFRYLADKLREAQVFILTDHGELMDRSKPRPELPGLTLQPPFPVVALEYASPASTARHTPGYSDDPCSRRISLAWRWTDDLPPALRDWSPQALGEGVVVASIVWFDRPRCWLPIAAGAHIAFDEDWRHLQRPPHVAAMVASGQITKAQAAAKTLPVSLIPFLPEAIGAMAATGGQMRALDGLSADLMDEVNAYTDLCYALACRNVVTERREQPAALNKARLRAGKLPFRDFHVLKLSSEEAAGTGFGGGHGSPRAHLRRGHIRRLRHLGPDRVTWVNATMVRGSGRGFANKAYAVRPAA